MLSNSKKLLRKQSEKINSLCKIKFLKCLIVILIVFLIIFLNSSTQLFASNLVKSYELIEMRSKNVKVFKNDDENYTYRVSATPVHYLTINGWKEIDNSLVLANNQFVISDSNYNVEIPAQLGLLPIDLSYFDLFSMKIFTTNPSEINFSAIIDTHSFETVRTFYDEKNSNLAVSSSVSFTNETEIFSVQSNKFSLLTSVRELYFELENLSVLNDESVLKFIDENGFCIYSINTGFLELNGYKTVIEKIDGNLYSLSLIELNIDDSLQTETLIPIQLDIIQNINADSNDFQDKYVIEGSTNLYFGSYVRIGESEYGILDPFGQIYYPVYKGIYELNFPFPPNDWIVTNAELSVRKMEFSTLDTQLGYITSEIPYENINGVTSYTVEDYVDDQFSSQYLTYDITDIINDRLQSNEDHLIFDITRKYNISQYARFYSAESNYSPIVEFTLNGAGYGETQYGTATIYTAVKPYLLNDINCFGYAVNVNDWLGLFDTPQEYSAVTVSNETLYTYYLPAVLSTLDENNLNGRILNDIDSAIFNVERRIAFRIGSVNDEIWRDSHFMKQHSNGNWSQKLGPLSSYQYPSGQTPNTINWNDWLSIYGQQYNTYYDSYVVYIAIYNDV